MSASDYEDESLPISSCNEEATSKDAEVMLKLGSTPDKREQYRLMRDAMEKRFIRVTRGSIIGGVRLGVFTAAFYGLQNLIWVPGSLKWRARNVALGAAPGAAVCFPLGWLHLKLVEKANEGSLAASRDMDQRGEARSGVGA
ncbi:hypothetical protein ACJRO7_026349 [Eucalyptus globulus]|uniref:Complex I assembly factor TIMMDC1, mitochondrial n=1 Tax=Eucalyptus globulus TaxID=34317 RepID=A0ABD3JUX9_EUCGL